jgi:hypothetical protein
VIALPLFEVFRRPEEIKAAVFAPMISPLADLGVFFGPLTGRN